MLQKFSLLCKHTGSGDTALPQLGKRRGWVGGWGTESLAFNRASISVTSLILCPLQPLLSHGSGASRVKRPPVQILVVVANIQMRTLKTEVEKGSM